MDFLLGAINFAAAGTAMVRTWYEAADAHNQFQSSMVLAGIDLVTSNAASVASMTSDLLTAQATAILDNGTAFDQFTTDAGIFILRELLERIPQLGAGGAAAEEGAEAVESIAAEEAAGGATKGSPEIEALGAAGDEPARVSECEGTQLRGQDSFFRQPDS